jgi:hypothetical protein
MSDPMRAVASADRLRQNAVSPGCRACPRGSAPAGTVPARPPPGDTAGRSPTALQVLQVLSRSGLRAQGTASAGVHGPARPVGSCTSHSSHYTQNTPRTGIARTVYTPRSKAESHHGHVQRAYMHVSYASHGCGMQHRRGGSKAPLSPPGAPPRSCRSHCTLDVLAGCALPAARSSPDGLHVADEQRTA